MTGRRPTRSLTSPKTGAARAQGAAVLLGQTKQQGDEGRPSDRVQQAEAETGGHRKGQVNRPEQGDQTAQARQRQRRGRQPDPIEAVRHEPAADRAQQGAERDQHEGRRDRERVEPVAAD